MVNEGLASEVSWIVPEVLGSLRNISMEVHGNIVRGRIIATLGTVLP